MLTAQTRVTPHPDVICTPLQNGDVVLLHMGSQTYFTLNATGAHIWDLIGQGLDVDAISQELVGRYEVDPGQAQQSVINLVNELTAAKLVTPA